MAGIAAIWHGKVKEISGEKISRFFFSWISPMQMELRKALYLMQAGNPPPDPSVMLRSIMAKPSIIALRKKDGQLPAITTKIGAAQNRPIFQKKFYWLPVISPLENTKPLSRYEYSKHPMA